MPRLCFSILMRTGETVPESSILHHKTGGRSARSRYVADAILATLSQVTTVTGQRNISRSASKGQTFRTNNGAR